MAPPLPATEWALPCQNVFDWKTQTEKFPRLSPFSPILTVFLTSCASPLPSAVHPSPHTERAAHPLQRSSRPNAAFCAETERGKGTLSSSLPSSLPLSPSLELCQSSLSR